MRTSIAPIAAAFVLSALAPSVAGAASAPNLGSIGEARLPEMLHPKDSPQSIPAIETIDGARVNHVKHRDFGSVDAIEGRCVTIGAIALGAVPSGNASAMIRASSSALPLRVERFVGAESGKPELEITDGWVDMTTGGIREERTTHISLTPIGKGPAGYVVYGFRSENKLHVVFPTPARFVFVDAFGKLGFAGCGHARLVLDPAASNGSLVRVAGTIEPPKSTSKKLSSNSKPPTAPPVFRGIEASVSVSRTKRDKEPLLSVTAGWSEDAPPLPVFGETLVEPAMEEHFEGPAPMPMEEDD
jgi:hypothetical protein